MRQILLITLKLNFTPNTLGCHGLKINQDTYTCFSFTPKTGIERPKTGVSLMRTTSFLG